MFTTLKNTRSEQGLTIPELLITIVIIGIIASVSVAAVVMSQQNSQTHLSSTAAQEALNYSVSQITRELSSNPTINYADDGEIFISTDEADIYYLTHELGVGENADWQALLGDKGSQVGISWESITSPTITEDNGLVLVEARKLKSSNETTITLLLSNIDKSVYENDVPMFTYYGTEGKLIPPITPSNPAEVNRVGLKLNTKIEGRTPLELVTSIALTNLGGISTETEPIDQITPAAPLLRGELPPRTQTATLTWNSVAGATYYQLYRKEAGEQDTLLGEFAENADLRYVDSGRPWNSDSTYYVISGGIGENRTSAPSNQVVLRTTPVTPAFININPTANPGEGNTVARDLTNHLTWTSSATNSEIQVRYALQYRVQPSTTWINISDNLTTTSYSHTGRGYGNTTEYRVKAYNATIPDSWNNPTGGDSFWDTGETPQSGTPPQSTITPPIRLVSPPIPPTLIGDLPPRTRTSLLTWNSVANATNYEIWRKDNRENVFTRIATNVTTTSYNDPNRPANRDTSYYIVAFNNAGQSTDSNTVTLRTTPDAPNFINKTSTTRGAASTVPTNNRTIARDLTSYFNWDNVQTSGPNDPAVRYRLDYWNGNNWIQVNNNLSSTSLIRSMFCGAGYQYRIVAYNPSSTPGVTGGGYTRDDNATSNAGTADTVTLESRPCAPTLIGRDYTTNNVLYDGVNEFTVTNWNNSKYLYTYGKGNNSGSAPTNISTVLNESSLRENVSHSSRIIYRVRACNTAGCANRSLTLNQPPPNISWTSLTQTKRKGLISTTEDTIPLVQQQTVLSHSGYSAANYTYTTRYAQNGSTYRTDNISRSNGVITFSNLAPGYRYTVEVAVTSRVSGLTRVNTYGFQTPPATPVGLDMHWKTNDGNNTITENLIHRAPVQGYASGTRYNMLYIEGSLGNYIVKSNSGWKSTTPSGNISVSSPVFKKSETRNGNPKRVGSLILARTVVPAYSGFTRGTVIDRPAERLLSALSNTAVDGGPGTSWTIFVFGTVGIDRPWNNACTPTGCNASYWNPNLGYQSVPYTAGNYPWTAKGHRLDSHRPSSTNNKFMTRAL